MSEDKHQYSTIFYLYSIFFILFCLTDTVLLFYFGKGSWLDSLQVYLTLVGAYGLALGLFAKSRILSQLKSTIEGLMNSNPLLYFASNCFFCVILLQFGVQGSKNQMKADAPKLLWFIGLFASLPILLLMLIYTVFHLLVIAPLAYLPLVIASSLIVKLRYAAGDQIVTVDETQISINKIVENNAESLKGFVMGVPSLALSLILAVLKIL